MKHRIFWGAAILIVLVSSLAWLALSYSSRPQEQGAVRLAQQAPPKHEPLAELVEDAPESPPPPPIRYPVRVESNDPMDLYQLVRKEARDVPWADESEAAIMSSLRDVVYVGRGSPLEVKCATTVCEVTGIAAPTGTLETLKLAWKALEEASRGEILARRRLVSTASLFGSGHSVNEFRLYFRRGELGLQAP